MSSDGPFCPPPSREDEKGPALPAVLQHANSFSLQPGSLQPPCTPRSIRATTLPSCLCPLLQGLLISPVPSQPMEAAIPGSRSSSFSLTSVLKVGRTHPKYLAQEPNSKHRGCKKLPPPFPSLPPTLKGHSFRNKARWTCFFPSLGRSRASTVSFLDVFVWTCMTPLWP